MSNIENTFRKQGIVKAVIKVPNSIHDGRTFVRSEHAYNIRFLNSPVKNGNMNCYGACFNSGTRVINYHDDDTIAEMFYIWAEVSNDLEFLIQPQGGETFVNVEGGMLENADLMLYNKQGQRIVDGKLNMDPNELFYHDIQDDMKTYIRNTPDNSNACAGYISALNEECKPLKTTKEKNTEIIYLTASGQYHNIPCNIGKTKSEFAFTIPDVGTYEFARSTDKYRIVRTKNNGKSDSIDAAVTESGAISDSLFDLMGLSSKKQMFTIYKDNFGRFLVQREDGKFWDGETFKDLDKYCLMTYEPNENDIFRFIDEKMIMVDVSFTKDFMAFTLRAYDRKVLNEIQFKDMSKKKLEDLGKTSTLTMSKEEELRLSRTYSDVNMDMGSINTNIVFPVSDIVNEDSADYTKFYKHENRIIPQAKFSKYKFNDEELFVFDWLSWASQINTEDYPFLNMMKQLFDNKFATTSNQMFDIHFKNVPSQESKIDSQENINYASSFGWNRYRDYNLNGELKDLRIKFNLLIQEIISMDTRYKFNSNSNQERIEKLVKELFLTADGEKLKRHNLAGLTFFRLCELFGMDKNIILNAIPTRNATGEYDLEFFSGSPFTTDNNQIINYSSLEKVANLTDINNPYIIVNGDGGRAVNIKDMASEILRLNCNKYVEADSAFEELESEKQIDYEFQNIMPKIGLRESGVTIRRDPKGKVFNYVIKIKIDFARISTSGHKPYRDWRITACEKDDGGPHGEHCWFRVPQRLSIDRANSTLPKELHYIYDKVDRAFEQRAIELVWFGGYGGCTSKAWNTKTISKHYVNGTSVMDNKKNGYCNYCFPHDNLTECNCRDRQTVSLYINYQNGMKVLQDELTSHDVKSKYGDYKAVVSGDLAVAHAIVSNPADSNILISMRNYHYNGQGSEFMAYRIFMWCRVNNWYNNCLGQNSEQYLCNKIIHVWDNINDDSTGYFEIPIQYTDNVVKDYCTKDRTITPEMLVEKTAPEIEKDYVSTGRMCNGITPEYSDFSKECIKCRTKQTITLRMFDDRFDKVMLNSLRNQQSIKAITNKFISEVTKLAVKDTEINHRIMYANIAYNLLPKIANRFTIENPIYPPAAIIDFSLLKDRGLYEISDEILKVNEHDITYGEPKTNLDSVFKKISEQLCDPTKIQNESTMFLIKFKTGCGHVNNLFEEPNDEFVQVKIITNEELSNELQDNNYCYFIFREENSIKDTEMNASDKLLQVGGIRLKVLRKTDDLIEFDYKTYIIYYNKMYGLGSNVNDSEADVEVNVGEIFDEQNQFAGIKYDYRLAPHAESVISWLRKFKL